MPHDEDEQVGRDARTPGAPAPGAGAPAPPNPPGVWRSLAELLGLCGLAVTQPLLDSFGRAPEAFSAVDASTTDVVVFALAVAVLPALALWVLELGVGLVNRTARTWLHRGLLALLAAATAMVVLRRSVDPVPLVAAAVGVAVAAALWYAYRYRPVRQWLAVLAVMPVLFVAVFLRGSPTGDLLAAPPITPVELDTAKVAQRSVVMVVFDEFPLTAIIDDAGRIDPELYPNLAALADDGTWFRNATTVATVTSIALPSMLTGRYPRDGLAPVAVDYPENLFTLLADGYEMAVEEQVTSLCPLAICKSEYYELLQAQAQADADGGAAASEPEPPVVQLARQAATAWAGLVSGAGPIGPAAIEEQVTPEPASAVDAAQADIVEGGGAPAYRVDAFDQLLTGITADEDPTLHFLHLQLPHAPYRFLPGGQAYQPFEGDDGLLADLGQRGPDQYEADLDKQRLLLQAGYADTLVGDLVQRLRDAGLYDDTVLMVTSDHGIGFVPDQLKRPLFDEKVDPSLYPDLLWVPLLIKAPGMKAGAIDDRNAMLVDLVPTIADLLDVEIPWKVDGVSLAKQPGRFNDFKTFNRSTEPADDDKDYSVAVAPRAMFDSEAVFAAMLERNVDALLRGTNPEHRLFDITDGGELVGSATDGLVVDRASGLVASVPELEALQSYDDDAGYVPVRFTGTVDGAGTDALSVAVAVDGVVAGVGLTRPGDDLVHHLDLMLAPALVAPGSHDVALYVIDGPEGARALWPISLS